MKASTGAMTSIIGLKILILLFIGYTYVDASSMETMDTLVMPAEYKVPNEVFEVAANNENLCTLCEKYASQALDFLNENETQFQIVNTLHKTCSQLHSLKEKCVTLVDYYVPLFFVEIAKVNPQQLCGKLHLCAGMTMLPLPKQDDTCDLCHHFVVEVLLKLKDPDTQLEIIEALLEGCSKGKNFAQECKRLVFEYGPLILVNAEKFIETNDICAIIRACKAVQEPFGEQVNLAVA